MTENEIKDYCKKMEMDINNIFLEAEKAPLTNSEMAKKYVYA